MNLAWRILLRLYPGDHRTLFAAEMLTVLEAAARERRGQGRTAFVRFAIAESIGLVTGSGAAWIAKLTRSDNYLHRKAAAASPGSLPGEVTAAQTELDAILGRMVNAIATHQFEQARFYSDQERKARANLRLLREKHGLDDGPGSSASGGYRQAPI